VALLVAATALATSTLPIGVAEGVVVCQRKKKLRVRGGDTCKKKEQVVVDLGALDAEVGSLGSRLDASETLAGDLSRSAMTVGRTLGFDCEGDPSRTLVSNCEPNASQGVTRGFLGGSEPCRSDGETGCEGACRRFDGDSAACAGAFQPGAGGGSSCAYVDGRCVGCRDCGQIVGRCLDVCQPPPTCADASRIRFVGETNQGGCERLRTQSDCEDGWGLVFLEHPTSCWWDATECRPCDDSDLADGSCSNVCAAPPTCADAGRTIGTCNDHDGDETTCNATWQPVLGKGISCFWDANEAECNTCFGIQEIAGRCVGSC